MALFPGEDLVETTTPDGRTIRVPSSLAAAMGVQPPPQAIGQTAPGPSFGEVVAPAQPVPDPGMGGGAPMGQLDQPPPITLPSQQAPEYTPPPVTPPPAEIAIPQSIAQSPASRAAAGLKPPQNAPPSPSPDDQLRGLSYGGIAQEQIAGLERSAEAGRAAAAAEAAQQEAFGQAYAQHEERTDKLFAAREKQAQEIQANLNRRTAEVETAITKLSNAKIDRGSDHPIINAIGIALAGLGQALDGQTGPNPAMVAMYAAIDRKVAGQMQDLDRQGKVIGLRKEQIETLRQQGADRIATTNMALAAENERAANHVKTLTARTSSPILKARGEQIYTDLMNRSTEFKSAAVDKIHAADQQKAALAQQERESQRQAGLGYANLAQRKFEFGQDLSFKREQLAAEQARALAAARAKGGEAGAKELAELQKENDTRGVSFGGKDSAPVLQPKGQAMLKEAAGLEEEAKKIKTSMGPLTPAQDARVKMLEDKAAEIRGDATIRYQFRARDTAEAKAVSKTLSDTQTALTTIDEIKQLREANGPKWISSSDGEKYMRTKGGLLALTIKERYKLGTLDNGSVAYLDKLTGGDPTKVTVGDITSLFGSEGGPAANLDAIASSLETAAKNEIAAIPNAPDVTFQRYKPEDPAIKAINDADVAARQDKSTVRQADQSGGGALTVAQNIFYPFQAARSEDDRQSRIENEASGKSQRPGLTEKQDKAVGQLLDAYKGGGKGKDAAEQRLLALATAADESLSTAAVGTLRRESPKLYRQALALLPDERKQAALAYDAEAAKPSPLDYAGRRAANAEAERALADLQARNFRRGPEPGTSPSGNPYGAEEERDAPLQAKAKAEVLANIPTLRLSQAAMGAGT